MATYELTLDGDNYSFDSSNENLSEEEAANIVRRQIGGAPPTITPANAKLPEPTVNGLPTGHDWVSAVSRRVVAAGQAALDIPSSLAGIVTGGNEGRLMSALKLIQGVTSPIGIALAPLEAVGEAGASQLGAGENWSQLAGDVTGLAGTLGLGMMAKAGVLGPKMMTVARLLGVGRSGKTIEEAMAHDPQLRYIVSREVEKSRAIQESAGIIGDAAITIPGSDVWGARWKTGGPLWTADEGMEVARQLGAELIGGVKTKGSSRHDLDLLVDKDNLDAVLKKIGPHKIETSGSAGMELKLPDGRGIDLIFKLGNKSLESLARQPASMEELALAAKSPALAENFLNQRKIVSDQYMEVARGGGMVGEVPAEARFSPEMGVEFQAIKPTTILPQWLKPQFIMQGIADQLPEGALKELIQPRPQNIPDLGLLGSLGTPGTVAARLNPEGGGAAYEMTLAQMKINQGVEARAKRASDAVMGMTGNEVKAAVMLRALETPLADIEKSNVSDKVKGLATWLRDKFEVDRQIIIPRIEEDARARITTQVEKELKSVAKGWGEKVDAQQVRDITQARIDKMRLNEWGIKEYLTRLWPGQVKIVDKEGNFIDAAVNGLEARFRINEIVSQHPELSGKLSTKTTAFFDSDQLKFFEGRVARQYRNIKEGVELTAEEIAAAEKGDFGIVGKSKFNPFLLERQGRAGGYSSDFQTILSTYDRTIERWTNLTDLSRKVAPIIHEISQQQPNLANMLTSTLKQAWGFKSPLSGFFDASIAKIPILRDIVAPGFLDKSTSLLKSGIVNAYLRFNLKFQAVNSTQLLATLWPIADGGDIAKGMKAMLTTEGKALLAQHGISGLGGKVEEFVKGLGPSERINQAVAFMTMYNKARTLGLADQAAADYAKLRGNIYSQFLGLTTDQPLAFQKAKFLAPFDMFTMFQRFPIKQTEIMIDLIKDRNFPGAAKWLGVNLALGGFKAATFGNAGWLTYKMYKDIEEHYGKTAADVFHTGLPALAGVDVSGSAQLFNPPFGDTFAEKVGNFLGGIVGSTSFSVLSAAMNSNAGDPSALSRTSQALIDRVPIAKQLDSLIRLFTEDYNYKDSSGRLRFEGDAKDAIKNLLGFRSGGGEMGVTSGPGQMRPAELDTFVSALGDIVSRRNEVINYAASRMGQARLSGVDLGEGMQKAVENEVNQWNSLWPQFGISGKDIMDRAKSKTATSMQTLGERVLKGSPSVIRKSGEFNEIPEGGG